MAWYGNPAEEVKNSFQMKQKDNLLVLAKRLQQMLETEEKTPDVTVANVLLGILKSGIAYCGKKFFGELMEWMLGNIRVENGVCAECEENPIEEVTAFEVRYCTPCARQGDEGEHEKS